VEYLQERIALELGNRASMFQPVRSFLNTKSEVKIVYFVSERCHNKKMQWWFCLIHKAVEAESGCPNQSRLGPYDSQALALGAIARISTRNAQLDEQDED
jgi:hypothetical protein